MPLYNSPLTRPQLLQNGVPAYMFGSLNMLQGNAKGTVADVALASGTGVLTVQINEGPIPLVGDLLTAWGTATSGGLFNVTRAVITAVSINLSTNAGTISFALSSTTITGITLGSGSPTLWATNDHFTIAQAGASGGVGNVATQSGGVPATFTVVSGGAGYTAASNLPATAISPSTGIGLTVTITTGSGGTIVTTPDAGGFLCEPGEHADTLTNNSFSSPVAVQPPRGDSQFTVPFAVTFGTIPTAATVTLQRAIRDIAAEYTNTSAVVTVASSAYTAGPTVLATLERGYVYRAAVTGVTGGTGIVAKIG